MNRLLIRVLLLASLTLVAACSKPTSESATATGDPRLKTFATQKRKQTEELAARLHLRVPRETRNFFKAAEAGDWAAISNQFARIRPRAGQYEGTTLDPAFNNVLWIPVQEAESAYALFAWSGPSLLQKYGEDILASIPAGSVYFGGTDPGRFAVTMFRDVAKSPDIFILTQNALADSRYMDYLRLIYGERLSLPGSTDLQAAFQQYADEYKTQTPSPNAQVTVDKDGRVSINGVEGVMAINGTLTKWIFDHNKDKHEFYLEESYVIPWMYSYLEPHGPIMKLNKEPAKELDPAVVTQDRQFWDSLTKELLANSRFRENEQERSTFAMFSKLRSAIGGLYAWRHLTSEAEAVFKQALTLCPDAPEANFHLAQLYMDQSRLDDAIAVLEQLQSRWVSANVNDRQHVAQAIDQLREAKRRAEETKAK